MTNEGDTTMTYKVSKELMNDLETWRENKHLYTGHIAGFIYGKDISDMPDSIVKWWQEPSNNIDKNNHLIAIIQWLNGEYVFKIKKAYKSHKFVVRSKGVDSDFDYRYLYMTNPTSNVKFPDYRMRESLRTLFDTREEAEKWLVPGYEVVEIDSNGKEVN